MMSRTYYLLSNHFSEYENMKLQLEKELENKTPYYRRFEKKQNKSNRKNGYNN